MPIFLTQAQVYRIIQRELPQGVYPDGPPSAFFSTADSWAQAKVVGDAYSNQARIYDNYFPQYTDENIGDWEYLILGKAGDATLTLQQRRDRVIAKIRSQRRTTPQDILATVYTVIDSSVMVEIAEACCGDTGWVLDESLLDISTILNTFNGLERVGADLCSLDASDYGLTPDEFAELQAQAYQYEVRIYGYTLTAQQRSDLDAALNEAEPARSRHIILDGLDPADSLGRSTC